MLVQVAFTLQLWAPVAHSFTSTGAEPGAQGRFVTPGDKNACQQVGRMKQGRTQLIVSVTTTVSKDLDCPFLTPFILTCA